ncbi:MAG: class I SAM-dependent methyltransferase [Oscillospiraceae bacterium]|nr:class I SAM-dependent methyltransferase [Oscillospiraceae bacterium]
MAKYRKKTAAQADHTAQPFQVPAYNEQVTQTIPFYREIHQQVLELVRTRYPNRPVTWLDTGCGTGTLAAAAVQQVSLKKLTLCDPSPFMLEQAKAALADAPIPVTFLQQPSQNLLFCQDFDVVTAIQAHHYLDGETRLLATKRCWEALMPGGIYLTVENMAPLTETGKEMNLRRWEQFQIAHGKSPEAAKEHIDRYGKAYFPISLPEHLQVLHEAGFQTAEVFWLSYLQIGLFGIK